MIVWPFYPNWISPYVERYEHLTEILVSHSGREQRRARRKAARRTIEYSTLATTDRLQTLLRLLERRDEPLVFPDEVRRTRPSATVAPDSATVTFADAPAWLTAGREAIFEDALTRERTLRVVESVDGDQVTFEDTSVDGWSTATRIMPALRGRLSSSIRVRATTNELGSAPITLEVDPGSETESVGAAPLTFNGREVLTLSPNWTTAPDIEIIDPVAWTDNEMGVRSPYRPVDFNSEIRQATYLLRDAAAADDLIDVFLRAKGRRGEFYQASGLSDFTLMQTVNSGSVFWRVAGHDFHAAYDGSTVHRAFAVVLRSGVTLRFRVIDITTGGTTAPYSMIETSDAAPYAIAPADVLMISWLSVARFASDELAVSWMTDSLAEAVLNTQTLEDL